MTSEDNSRLERIMEAGFETLADLMRETNTRLGRLEDRFDNFLVFVGDESRKMRRDVDDLTVRVEKIEDSN